MNGGQLLPTRGHGERPGHLGPSSAGRSTAGLIHCRTARRGYAQGTGPTSARGAQLQQTHSGLSIIQGRAYSILELQAADRVCTGLALTRGTASTAQAHARGFCSASGDRRSPEGSTRGASKPGPPQASTRHKRLPSPEAPEAPAAPQATGARTEEAPEVLAQQAATESSRFLAGP